MTDTERTAMFSFRYDELVEHEGFEPSGTSLQSNTRNITSFGVNTSRCNG